jgi:hypothetical protein
MSGANTFKAPLSYFRGLLHRYGFITKKARSMEVLSVWGGLTRDAKLWRGVGRGKLPLEMRLAELTTAEIFTLRQRSMKLRKQDAK